MQSENGLNAILKDGEPLDELTKHATVKQREEALLASPGFKKFMSNLREVDAKLRDNPEAQMEHAKTLW